jgi:PTH1 family peptidyl-tRNA hydrolase
LASVLRVVAGLGNPGRSYAATRHNAGFWFADRLAGKLGASFRLEAKFGAEVAKAGDLRIVKPMTFMNLSGRAVGGVARFFGVDAAAILVAHDELDLAPGDARLKFGGGTAGHNGLRDIQAQLGTASFWRLRLGIGHPRDTQAPEREVVDYVLKSPSADDRRAIDEAIDRALDAWRDVAAGAMERAMTLLHTPPREASPGRGTA